MTQTEPIKIQIKKILDYYTNRIKETKDNYNQETDTQVKSYLLGLIDGFQFMTVALRVLLMQNLFPQPQICKKHNKALEELWENEWGCSECHYEAFHYATEGVN